LLNRSKKAIILIFIVIFSLNLMHKEIPNTESVEPFFTLVAYAKNPTHSDYFNLIKQQMWRLGVNLDIVKPSAFQWDHSGWYDLEILDIYYSSISSPFHWNYYSENGTYSIYGYDTNLDWDDDLNTGKNQWYIENGLQMIANNSDEVINHCWDWQNYLMDKVLPCLPLFVQKNDSNYFQVLVYSLKETHPIIGSREPSFTNAERSVGLAIRKAITYAINREEIRRVVLGDEFKIIDHPINPFMGNWCNPNVVRYCHDLEVARRYFTSAGFYTCCIPDPNFVDTYPDWTDWEAVCSRNNQTIDVAGFDILIALGVLTFFSISFIISKLKNKRKKIRSSFLSKFNKK